MQYRSIYHGSSGNCADAGLGYIPRDYGGCVLGVNTGAGCVSPPGKLECVEVRKNVLSSGDDESTEKHLGS